ncbi:tRNA threonylcarbamoyladenosine biosynthesis protein TsaB [Roseovarius sp. A-2]|uniref:tRNA (adenosine(37)-N6)-threonylcarbamoyltransferase complex dimerization subunit type 1 TsaB n=1 Tax=Roseovarius sp. A-2 TaxID=1570360 RepID=UPI0009B54D98|nr:tRNA (adenosine(37)-N6)-threonylcarbamoyltransferase complex dimerization subunit type 1 TsaB [Roseovarius sp. A-2]GAW34593.1 tRNA threonylcarbamoyladenosine biosynthesis protein TsaB [Roseovarius sp. A-2]
MSEPLILGFDTSAAHCAAALLCGDRVLVVRAEDMGRGQAERLMPLLEEVLAEGGVRWRDLARIGVGIGPGNFTGIRISVAAARGLALSLGIPAIGISTLEAIRAGHERGTPCVPAPRDQGYVQRAGHMPDLVAMADIADAVLPPAPARLAERIARLATLAPGEGPPPAPLYVRPADAAPARDAPPEILDDA